MFKANKTYIRYQKAFTFTRLIYTEYICSLEIENMFILPGAKNINP